MPLHLFSNNEYDHRVKKQAFSPGVIALVVGVGVAAVALSPRLSARVFARVGKEIPKDIPKAPNGTGAHPNTTTSTSTGATAAETGATDAGATGAADAPGTGTSTTSYSTGSFWKRYYEGGFEEKMTKREAAQVLGCRESATKQTILDRYRKLMRKNHPDMGGSPYISSKISEAKELLSKRARDENEKPGRRSRPEKDQE